MKADEIRGLGPAGIMKQIEEAHRELFNIRIRVSTRQLANHREIRKTKRKIARLNTILRELELGG
ncbi:MAG: 50S ribosomal protein L29 [Chloroflexi bacterium]|nr:50S ribosomal protein L29 [Chloroflexota bacterium]